MSGSRRRLAEIPHRFGKSSRRRYRNATAWSPIVVPGIAAWYKADAITPQADGSTLASWPDSYGTTHLVQATEANKPLYETNELNTLPAVHSVDDSDSMTNSLNAGSQPFTVFAVARMASWSTNHDICGAPTDGSNWRIGFEGTGNDARIYAGASLVSANNSLAFGNAYVFTGLFNGASSVLRVNGGLAGATGDAGANAFGTTFRVFGPSNAADDMFIFEIIVYSGDKTSSFGTIEAYLAAKWGITLT